MLSRSRGWAPRRCNTAGIGRLDSPEAELHDDGMKIAGAMTGQQEFATSTQVNQPTSATIAAPVPEDSLAALRLCISPASFWTPDHIGPYAAWLEHGPFAFWIVEALESRIITELGTVDGYSYFAFCQAVRELERATRCYAVSPRKWDAQPDQSQEGMLGEVEARNGSEYAAFSTLIRADFAQALSHFDDGMIDLLHMDGRRPYDELKLIFTMWRPKLSDRAVVMLGHTSVSERGYGGFRFWDELRGSHPSFEFLHGGGLGIAGLGTRLSPRLSALFAASKDTEAARFIRDAYSRLGAAVTLQFETDRFSAERAALEHSNDLADSASAILRRQLAECQEIEAKNLDAVLNSISWRVTAPLRAARRFLRRQ